MLSQNDPRFDSNHDAIRIWFDFTLGDIKFGEFELFVRPDKKEVSVWNVEIIPEHRGHGFGNQLVEEMVEVLNQDFFDFERYLLVDPANTPAVKAYTKYGFANSGKPSTCFMFSRMDLL